MYDIIELKEKNLEELLNIAGDLKITKAKSYSQEDLIYKILDEQAIQSVNKPIEKIKKKPRERIVSRKPVISVTQEGAVTSREDAPLRTVDKVVQNSDKEADTRVSRKPKITFTEPMAQEPISPIEPLITPEPQIEQISIENTNTDIDNTAEENVPKRKKPKKKLVKKEETEREKINSLLFFHS